ncbi:MAG TPA: ATP synthase F0 subunit B [Candidatus Binataceae bacterium]|nr:ATP synthase F0 subunit B [Candidatus Binataceae bacterium]
MMKKTIISVTAISAALLPALVCAAEEAGGEEQGSWLVLLFFAINFLIFVFIIRYFAAPVISKFFADRSTQIRGTLSRAESAFAEAQDLANKAAARSANLDNELATLQKEIENETQFQVKKIADVAQAAVERLHTDVSLTSAALAEAGQRRVREELAAVTARLARDLIARSFDSSDQQRLVENFTERLEGER